MALYKFRIIIIIIIINWKHEKTENMGIQKRNLSPIAGNLGSRCHSAVGVWVWAHDWLVDFRSYKRFQVHTSVGFRRVDCGLLLAAVTAIS